MINCNKIVATPTKEAFNLQNMDIRYSMPFVNSLNTRNKKRTFDSMQDDKTHENNSNLQKNENINPDHRERRQANVKYNLDHKFIRAELQDTQLCITPRKRVSFASVVNSKLFPIDVGDSAATNVDNNISKYNKSIELVVDCNNESPDGKVKSPTTSPRKFYSDRTKTSPLIIKLDTSQDTSKNCIEGKTFSPMPVIKLDNLKKSRDVPKTLIENQTSVSVSKLDNRNKYPFSPKKYITSTSGTVNECLEEYLTPRKSGRKISETLKIAENKSLMSPKIIKNIDDALVVSRVTESISVISLASKKLKNTDIDDSATDNSDEEISLHNSESNNLSFPRVVSGNNAAKKNSNTSSEIFHIVNKCQEDDKKTKINEGSDKTKVTPLKLRKASKIVDGDNCVNKNSSPTIINLSGILTPRKSPRKITESVNKFSLEKNTLLSTDVPNYIPVNFLRCHFGDKKALKQNHLDDDDPSDDVTNVWACAFEPNLNDPNKTTSIVATCGGNTMCLIDCSSSLVLKRFKANKEQFYCLAWTTLDVGCKEGVKRCNVLALSGYNGHIKLIRPDNLSCYLEHGSGRPNKSVQDFYYSCLIFHPRNPTWLFCGSSDSTISWFDIGVPDSINLQTEIKMIGILNTNPCSAIVTMEIMKVKDGFYLFAGTASGCVTWSVDKSVTHQTKSIKKCESQMSLTLPPGKENFVDGLAIVSLNLLACKVVGSGCIYIFDVAQIGEGSCRLMVRLDWCKTQIDYIGMTSNSDYILTGSDTGSIIFYVTKDILANLESSRSFPINYVEKWPKCTTDEPNINNGKKKKVPTATLR